MVITEIIEHTEETPSPFRKLSLLSSNPKFWNSVAEKESNSIQSKLRFTIGVVGLINCHRQLH
jgi:hypothetical protein